MQLVVISGCVVGFVTAAEQNAQLEQTPKQQAPKQQVQKQSDTTNSSPDNSVSSSASKTAAQSQVIEEAVLGMNVTGNKELPNMLYIVPWKAKAPPLSSPSVQPLLQEVFSTLDPEVFNRESAFYFKLTEPATPTTESAGEQK